jgi:hypothetical protein
MPLFGKRRDNSTDGFGEEFDSTYNVLVAEGPTDRQKVSAWAEKRFGPFSFPSGRWTAMEWRRDNLVSRLASDVNLQRRNESHARARTTQGSADRAPSGGHAGDKRG